MSARPDVRVIRDERGRTRFEHEITIGSWWVHEDSGDRVKVVGPGRAGMPEVKNSEGITFYANPLSLAPIK